MADINRRLELERERVHFSEVLKAASETQGRAAKIELLQKYANKSPEYKRVVQQFMETCWHPAVKFELPEGEPPYKDAGYKDYSMAPMLFGKALSRVKYFCKCPSFIDSTLKRERTFIQTLESMYQPDALLYCMIKDKKLDTKVYPTMTEKLFREAFPGILPGDSDVGEA